MVKEPPAGRRLPSETALRLHGVSGDPLLGLPRDGDKGFEVIETKRYSIAPRSGLILERPREGRREERSFLAITVPAIHKRGQLVGCPLGLKHLRAES
jgi:hypothetical protein